VRRSNVLRLLCDRKGTRPAKFLFQLEAIDDPAQTGVISGK